MKGSDPYVELHAHSAYSFLDGASLPEELAARAAELGHDTLALTDQAVAKVAEAGYDPVYGARPLKRALQKLVIDPLATHLLAGDFQPGDHIEVEATSTGEITFHKNVKGAAA